MEMLEPLIASPYMGVVVVDRNGFITDMNQTYLKLLETSPDEVMGQIFWMFCRGGMAD
jgi:PAS domain-containing protein